jgi:hypothetical protein
MFRKLLLYPPELRGHVLISNGQNEREVAGNSRPCCGALPSFPWTSGRPLEIKLMKTRYQPGSIRKVPRATGFAWEVRFSERKSGKRHQRTLNFDLAA